MKQTKNESLFEMHQWTGKSFLINDHHGHSSKCLVRSMTKTAMYSLCTFPSMKAMRLINYSFLQLKFGRKPEMQVNWKVISKASSALAPKEAPLSIVAPHAELLINNIKLLYC